MARKRGRKKTGDLVVREAESAAGAVLRLLQLLIQAARSYEEGIMGDHDSECVHQYRVNLRKARSLLSQFKAVLPPERYRLLNPGLKSFARRTNRLRDLDVMLSCESSLRLLLPQELHSACRDIFFRLHSERNRIQEQLGATLSSRPYRQLATQLLEAVQPGPDPAHGTSGRTIGPLARKKILKQYRLVCATGAAIEAKTGEETLHDLRISCKKLRYLLELFASLLAKESLKPLLRRLKLLQDLLGEFNDSAVQQKILREMRQAQELSRQEEICCEQLVTILSARQEELYGPVVEQLAGFCQRKIRSEFEELCNLSEL